MDMVVMGVTATARGLLMPMPTMVVTDTADMVVTATARGLLMPMPTMVATDTADMVVTAMARGLLMPMPTMVATAMARGLLTLTMVAMDMVATLTASNLIDQENHTPKKPFSKSKFLQSFTLDLSNHYLGLNQ